MKILFPVNTFHVIRMLKKDIKRFLKKYPREDTYVFVSKAEAKKIVECNCNNAYRFILSSDKLMSDLTVAISLCNHQFEEILNMENAERSETKSFDLHDRPFKGVMICDYLTEKVSVLIDKHYWHEMSRVSVSIDQLQLLNVDELVLKSIDKESILVILSLLHTNRLKKFTMELDWFYKSIFQPFDFTSEFQGRGILKLTSTTISAFSVHPYALIEEKPYDYDKVVEHMEASKK